MCFTLSWICLGGWKTYSELGRFAASTKKIAQKSNEQKRTKANQEKVSVLVKYDAKMIKLRLLVHE